MDPEDRPRSRSRQRRSTKGRRSATRILAVDDESGYLETLEALLSGEGYEVLTTTSAAGALEVVHKFNPALLATDLNMHPCDGVDLLRMVAERHLLPGVPRVILSSAPDEVVRRRMRDGGVDADVIDKNGGVDVLLAVIGRLCHKHLRRR